MQHRGFNESLPHMPFGAYLKVLRDRHEIKQSVVLAKLPETWTQPMYSNIERGRIAPSFQDLEQIYLALSQAGVQLTSQDRMLFLQLAQERLEGKQTHRVHESPEAWEALRRKLARIDQAPDHVRDAPFTTTTLQKPVGQTPRYEIGHLIGRASWLTSTVETITRVKVLVLQGPPGSGKTSEVHRIANHFLRHIPRYYVVLSEPSPIQLEQLKPVDVLETLLEDIGNVLGPAYATLPTSSLHIRMNYIVNTLAKADRPTMIALDNAEHIFDSQGNLEVTWRQFLMQFAQTNHRATLVIASQEWPAGAFLVESQLMALVAVPPLSDTEGSQLLQTLGLRNVPNELLLRAVDAVDGIPVCIEWIVRLVREPYLRDEWADELQEEEDGTTLARLLDDPAIFGGAVAQRVQPLLERVLKRLSKEAMGALQDLAISLIPLGAPALKVLYPSPRVLRELREASLLVSYPQRVQLLPMVAAQVRERMSDAQVIHAEERLIQALSQWLYTGAFHPKESGTIITELAALLMKHRQLFEAAHLLIRYGWASFNQGHGPRLAHLALEQEHCAQGQPQEQAEECGTWLLHYLLSPYAGQKINRTARAEQYQRILDRIVARTVEVEPQTELFIVRHLMFYEMEHKQFEKAQALVGACEQRLAIVIRENPDLLASCLEKRGYLYTNWCEDAEEAGNASLAQWLRKQAITVYRQSNQILTEADRHTTPLKRGGFKKRLAKSLTNLGYHLNRLQQYSEAVTVLRQSIELKEAGFSDFGSLPASYGELSQALAEQGSLAEAIQYDERALEHMERLADSGDTVSQETIWIYRVNRARLYVKLGRLTEAKNLLDEAIEKIPARWEMYRMFANQTLEEIEKRKSDQVSPPRYDGEWVDRYRELVSFDSFAWLAPTCLTPAQQEEWEHLRSRAGEAMVKKRMETILAEGKQNELLAAIREQREPRFTYPAIPLEEVRTRIQRLSDLAEEIRLHEKNEVVRRLYSGDPTGREKGAIPYQIAYLRAIEATALGNGEAFWQHICVISPPPTVQEMRFALSRVKWFVQQGRTREDTSAVSERVVQFLEQRLLLSLDTLPDTQHLRTTPILDTSFYGKPAAALRSREFSPETVGSVFNALFREQGYQGWKAIVDYAARNTRIEPGLRQYILAGIPYSIGKLTEQLAHEWGGHVAPRVAGERSAFGLLGLGTGWSLTTEEGLGLFYEIELAKRTGQRFDEAKIYLGTLATGLAAGVLVPAQSFLSLYTFLADFLLLYRLIYLGREDMETARAKAQTVAQTRCLRTYRGVPNLIQPGMCYPKDAAYQRGLFQVYDAVAQDPAVLDWLAAGVIALEQIADLQALNIPPAPRSSRSLLDQPDLEAYLVSLADHAPSAS